jgi:hypothetical protein
MKSTPDAEPGTNGRSYLALSVAVLLAIVGLTVVGIRSSSVVDGLLFFGIYLGVVVLIWAALLIPLFFSRRQREQRSLSRRMFLAAMIVPGVPLCLWVFGVLAIRVQLL